MSSDPASWESRVQKLLVAASPLLAEYRTTPAPWWSPLAERLRPRLPLTVAAAAVLAIAVHLSIPAPVERAAPSLPLATVIGGGSATAAAWPLVDEEIDPVLALLILEGETP